MLARVGIILNSDLKQGFLYIPLTTNPSGVFFQPSLNVLLLLEQKFRLYKFRL